MNRTTVSQSVAILAAMLAGALIPGTSTAANAGTPIPTPTPTPECTPVFRTECPTLLDDATVHVGDTFTVFLHTEIIGCGCDCQDDRVSTQGWSTTSDSDYLMRLTPMVDPLMYGPGIYPGAEVQFQAIKAGTTSVMAGTYSCDTIVTNTVTILDAVDRTATPSPTDTPLSCVSPLIHCPESIESVSVETGTTFSVQFTTDQPPPFSCQAFPSEPGYLVEFDPELLEAHFDISGLDISEPVELEFVALHSGTAQVTITAHDWYTAGCYLPSISGTITITDPATPTETPLPTPSPCETDGEPPYSVSRVDSVRVQVGQQFDLHYDIRCDPNSCGHCNFLTNYEFQYDSTILQGEGSNWNEHYATFLALKAGTTEMAVSGYAPFGGGFGGESTGTVTVTPGRTAADFDDSGCTDLADFLYLLDYWQLVAPVGGEALGLSDFLTLLDNWTLGDSCGA